MIGLGRDEAGQARCPIVRRHVLEPETAVVRGVERDVAEGGEGELSVATALGQVNAAVNQLDQVTQRNAAMVSQSTDATHALRVEAADLSNRVGAFRFGARAQAAPQERPAENPVHAARARVAAFARPGR